MEETNQGNGSKRIYLAIIALLLLINGVAGYLLYNENKQKEEKITQVQQKDDELVKMTHQLDSTRQDLENQRGHSADLDSIINARQAELDKTRSELTAAVKRGNLSDAEKKKYKELVAKYEADNQDLQRQIKELTAKNEELTAQNLQVTHNLEVEKKTTASLTDDKNKLSKKVELGSLLHLQNLTVTGEKKKKNGKEVAQKSAKKTDFIKISFETGDNKVLEKGNVTIYLRVINPKGETIALADQGSGTLKLADGSGEVQYSRTIDMDWDQTSQKKEIEWSQNIKEPGTYKVEVYQSGYLIGNSSVVLK